MIYETAVVLGAEISDDAIAKFKSTLEDTFKEYGAEVLVRDDWGVKKFGQATNKGVTHGRYVYYMYHSATGDQNVELERRYRISEDVLKFIVVKLGPDKHKEVIVKEYISPNAAKEEEGGKLDSFKEKKVFSKTRSCYFSAKKTKPDWKDPNSYAWLVNEFGKISAARVTGLRPKYQRMATTAIKRARCMGMLGYTSSRTLR